MQVSTLLKKRPWHRCFPVNFGKFLRTPALTQHCSYRTVPAPEDLSKRLSLNKESLPPPDHHVLTYLALRNSNCAPFSGFTIVGFTIEPK